MSVEWPLHTMTGFDALANDIRTSAALEAVSLAPWVQGETQKRAWEAYAASEGFDTPWINDDSSSNVALPLWQMVPQTTDTTRLINLNLLGLDNGLLSEEVVTAAWAGNNETSSIWARAPATLAVDNDGTDAGGAVLVMQPVRHPYNNAMGAVSLAVLSWPSLVTNILADAIQHYDPIMIHVTTLPTQETIALYVQQQLHSVTLHDNDIPEIPADGCFTNVCFQPNEWFHICIVPAVENDTNPDASTKYVVLTAVFCAVMLMLFCIYDSIMFRAQRELATAADQSLAVVSSLFPKNFQDRLLDPSKAQATENKKQPPEERPADKGGDNANGASSSSLFGRPKRGITRTKSSLTTFMYEQSEASEHGGGLDFLNKTKPIADLFPDTTIFFGDLVGFTAWSSAREPTSVFRLLETIFYHFDELAKQRRVFKVRCLCDGRRFVFCIEIRSSADSLVVLLEFDRWKQWEIVMLPWLVCHSPAKTMPWSCVASPMNVLSRLTVS